MVKSPIMTGLSESSLQFEQARAPGTGAVLVESPIPRGAPGTAGRQEERLARRVAPIGEDREQFRSGVSGSRDTEARRDRDAASVARHRTGQGTAGSSFPLTGGRPIGGAAHFAAQLLSQSDETGPSGRSEVELLRASEAYRRSGAEPPLYPDTAAVFSLAV